MGWRVFLPLTLKNYCHHDEGQLVGRVCQQSKSICITGLTPRDVVFRNPSSLSDFNLQVVGELDKCSNPHAPFTCVFPNSPKAGYSGVIIDVEGFVRDESVVYVWYKPERLYGVTQLAHNDPSNLGIISEAHDCMKCFLVGRSEMCEFVASLVTCEEKSGPVQAAISGIWQLLFWLAHLFRILRYLERPPGLGYLGRLTSLGTDISSRVELISRVSARSSQDARWRNVALGCALNVCVGGLLAWLLLTSDWPETLAPLLMGSAEDTVSGLRQLLHWLMGVPAGLKLNFQLNQFMGNFFLYHVYLWTAYLSILEPLLPTALRLAALSGVLGVSCLLATLRDLLSMMTLHVYCFYVYAARTYGLQMTALQSLWRLFRGKKWNVLRSRVDSCNYDVNQLFVGTLLFAVLLFLLPTTALYYCVFAALRLVVLVCQGTLAWAVALLSRLPPYSLLLWLVGSSPSAEGTELELMTSPGQHGPPQLFLKLKSASLSHVLRTDWLGEQGTLKYSLRDFVGHLFSGRLLYPWSKSSNWN